MSAKRKAAAADAFDGNASKRRKIPVCTVPVTARTWPSEVFVRGGIVLMSLGERVQPAATSRFARPLGCRTMRDYNLNVHLAKAAGLSLTMI